MLESACNNHRIKTEEEEEEEGGEKRVEESHKHYLVINESRVSSILTSISSYRGKRSL